MNYTRDEILLKCRRAFEDKKSFYKQNFINYRGRTTDTQEYYTEVTAEFLCAHIGEYINGIPNISRSSSYKTEGHDGIYDPESNREEEKIAMQLFTQSKNSDALDFIGKIIDYQIPLKSSLGDKAGKIDLLSFDGEVMRILELKKPDSKETMLRCVLEGFTYMKTADCKKLISDYGYNPAEVTVKACPLVFSDGMQYAEMSDQRPNLRKLMQLLDSSPYYIVEKEKYSIVRD